MFVWRQGAKNRTGKFNGRCHRDLKMEGEVRNTKRNITEKIEKARRKEDAIKKE